MDASDGVDQFVEARLTASSYSYCPVFGEHRTGYADGVVASLKFYRKVLTFRTTSDENFFHIQ